MFVSLDSDDDDDDDNNYDDDDDDHNDGPVTIDDGNFENEDVNGDDGEDTSDNQGYETPENSDNMDQPQQMQSLKNPALKEFPKCPPNSLEKYSSSDIDNSSSGKFSCYSLVK